ncbi:MAG: Holliday junction resolvase RuvX [Vulcanimicrobiota bacterium]
MKNRILALDPGSKRIGAAISDPLGISAKPLDYIPGSSWRKIISGVKQLIQEHQPGLIVVGLPLNLDGSHSFSTEKALELVKRLEKFIQIPIKTVDERLTSREANNILIEGDVRRAQRKQVVDSMAACLILKKYLEQGVEE